MARKPNDPSNHNNPNYEEVFKEMGNLPMGKKPSPEESLARINLLLRTIKEEINANFRSDTDDKPGNELTLFIKHNKTNPWGKQTEDIEPDVVKMKGMI